MTSRLFLVFFDDLSYRARIDQLISRILPVSIKPCLVHIHAMGYGVIVSFSFFHLEKKGKKGFRGTSLSSVRSGPYTFIEAR